MAKTFKFLEAVSRVDWHNEIHAKSHDITSGFSELFFLGFSFVPPDQKACNRQGRTDQGRQTG